MNELGSSFRWNDEVVIEPHNNMMLLKKMIGPYTSFPVLTLFTRHALATRRRPVYHAPFPFHPV